MATEARGEPRPWRLLYVDALTLISPGLLMGALCGGLIGGVGGRLAMFALRITSEDSLHGMETDDGFIIGSFTADTAFLVVATTFLGALGGLFYMGVRPWLTERFRWVLYGLLGATAGGALVIRPDGIDFTLLKPLELAVAMFVLIPAAYGVALSLLTERLVQSTGFRQSRWRWAAVPLLLSVLLAGSFGVGFLLIVGLVIAVNRSGRFTRLWRSAPVTWVGRSAYALALAASGALLLSDVVAVL